MRTNNYETEIGYLSINHVGEELCGDNVSIISPDDSTKVVVLADGLGSGVKANILSTLTAELLSTMIANNIPIEDCVHSVLETLPVCKVRGVAYSGSDFDEIVKIIFEQNCINPIDNTIQKEVRDALEKAEEFKMQQTKQKMCSLEEQMICVLISTPLKLEDIYKLTIRKFEKILQRVDAKLHYQIYLNASMSGMVKFKDESVIQHWMNDLTKDDRYSDVKVDMDTMRNKIESVNK